MITASIDTKTASVTAIEGQTRGFKMSEDSSKREREFQFELAKLQVDYQYYFMVFIRLIAFLLGVFCLFYYFAGVLVTYISVGAVALFLFVAGCLKEIRFEEIREEYKLFARMETQELESS
jgi:hypothetical protein